MADKIIIGLTFILSIFTLIMAWTKGFPGSYAPALFQIWGIFLVLFYFKYINRG